MFGESGLYLVGAYSTDMEDGEFSIYIGPFAYGRFSIYEYGRRLDSGEKCKLSSNNTGGVIVTNPTSGKTYKYYSLQLAKLL